MRILFTNQRLGAWGGSEAFLRDMAIAVRERGHQPAVYAPELGDAADDLRQAGIPVVRRLDLMTEPPDVIHGQHHLPTMEALLHFPGVPAVFFCLGFTPEEEHPPVFPRIGGYAAVDELRRQRLVTEEGIDPALVTIVPNRVDLRRFPLRPDPPPARPEQIVVLSNKASPDEGFGQMIRRAARHRGIALSIVGSRAGTATPSPEFVLASADLVFARGRAAMEAMATGAAVVLCDVEGLGPLVTGDNVAALAADNFGATTLTEAHRMDTIADRIAAYDPGTAMAASAWIREHAALDGTVDLVLDLYERAAAVVAGRSVDPGDELRAVARYLAVLQEAVLPPLRRDAARYDRVRAGLGPRRRPAQDPDTTDENPGPSGRSN